MKLRFELVDLGPGLAAVDALPVDSLAAFAGGERPLGGLAALLDWRMAGALSRAILAGTVAPENGEALLLPTGGRLPAARVFLFGVEDTSPRAVSISVRHACEALHRAGARSVGVGLPQGPALDAAARTWVETSATAGFDRVFVLGDPRLLLPALEGAGRELGTPVEVVRATPVATG